MKNNSITPREIEIFLDKTLFNIEKPGRYTGGEYNQIVKDWESTTVKTILAFPDVYELGFSNLGLDILYDQVNFVSDFLAERCFSVWDDMEMAMRNSNIPLFSLESKHPIFDFDVVGISLPYETLYTNTLNLLDLSGIPISHKDRSDSDPLIVAGGHASFNPTPMSAFMDAFVIGDGEHIFLQILQIVKEGLSRQETLVKLSCIDGIYIPALYDVQKFFSSSSNTNIPPIKKNMVAPLPPAPEKLLVPNIETTHNRIAIEVMRGCSHGCRFCQAGFITRPVRERPMEEILESLRTAIKQTGYDEISLLSLSISDYSSIQDLVLNISKEFKGLNVNLSLPSLRIESFSKELMQAIDQRKGNFTLAPESATESMRRSINKPICDEDLLETASLIFQKGWNSLKLYFLIGLPGETLDDVVHIVDLCRKVKAIGKKFVGGRARISVSINTFIPKCHTPFQWAAMDSIENIAQKHRLLREEFRNTGILLSFPSMESSLLEGWLSRGDENTADVIYSAWQKGARFDAWQDRLDLDIWKAAFSEKGIDPYTYSHRERPLDEDLTWDFIDTGVSKTFLKDEYLKSAGGSLTDDCRNNCHACGIQSSYDILCGNLVGK
ncbi:MAG: TIGR03960 family B12-binding radical SAM protein [Anaerolineaceae bacterium]